MNIDSFIELCNKGSLEKVKTEVKKNSNLNLTSFKKAFCNTCINGHLEIAKWLLEIKPDINVSIDDEQLFYNTCINGHLKVAKWLLKIKPDINISINDEYTFSNTCENGHLKVAKWLLEIKPDINISINDE